MAQLTGSIKVVVAGSKITVASPYNPQFVDEARKLNGRWDSSKEMWVFDARDEERVRGVLVRCYGTDGDSVPETTSVRVTVTSRSPNPLFLYGRELAWRRNRDGRVRLGDSVVVVEGQFPVRCGSARYPGLTIDDVVIEVRDVPVSLVDPQ